MRPVGRPPPGAHRHCHCLHTNVSTDAPALTGRTVGFTDQGTTSGAVGQAAHNKPLTGRE